MQYFLVVPNWSLSSRNWTYLFAIAIHVVSDSSSSSSEINPNIFIFQLVLVRLLVALPPPTSHHHHSMSNQGSKEELDVRPHPPRAPPRTARSRLVPSYPRSCPLLQATLQAAFAKRLEGNEHFKLGEFVPALQCYHHVLLVLKGE